MSETVRLFADAWKVLIGRFPSARIEEADGVVSCIGNVSQVFFNASIINRPAVTHHELRALLDTAAERAADCHHPCGVIVREDWLPSGWEALIQDAGLAPLVPMTGMETTELLPPRRPAAKVEIRRVASDATARDLVELNAHAYGMAADAFECIANMYLWHADSFGYESMFSTRGVLLSSIIGSQPGHLNLSVCVKLLL